MSDPAGKDERFEPLLDEVCARFGMDYAAYAGLDPVSGRVHGFVNYPDRWKAHYAALGLERIDPTLHRARRSIAPVDWRRLAHDPDYERVFGEAEAFGISRNGMTIPVRGPYGDTGLLSVTRNCSPLEWDKHAREAVSGLQSYAVHIHDRVMASDKLGRVLRHPNLSAREREILQWTAAGKTQMDIGDILSISHRTVEVHLKSSRDKLSALTTAQAVARGISAGLIFPS